MKTLIPFKFADGDNLSPSKLNANVARMRSDLASSKSRRFYKSSFKMDFTGLSNTDSAVEHQVLIKAPKEYEVIGVELYLWDAAGITASLSPSGGILAAVVATSAGATTRVKSTSNENALIAANTEVTWTLTVTGGAYTLDRCYAVVHIKATRNSSDSVTANKQVAAGETNSVAGWNTFFTDYEAEVTADAAATDGLRIHVMQRRGMGAAFPDTDRDFRLPSSGQRMHSIDVVNLGGVGNDLTINILDSGLAITIVDVPGSGSPPAKVQSTPVSTTQTPDDPADGNDDYQVRFSRVGAGVIDHAYAVLYFV